MNYNPSERIKNIRDRVISNPPEKLQRGWWMYYYFKAFMAEDNKNLTLTERHAKAYANVINNMPLLVYADDLIAGEHYDDPCENFTGEYDGEFLQGWIDVDCPFLPDDIKKELKELALKNPLAYRKDVAGGMLNSFPEMKKAIENGVISVFGTAYNHSIKGFDRVLKKGFVGIKKDIEEAITKLDSCDGDYLVKLLNYKAWLIVCDACINFGKRHADYLIELAEKEQDVNIKNNYLEMAKLCQRVPAEPARTFKEAVQSLWLSHIISTWEDGVNANGLGRIDQMLYPFYKADLEAGRITEYEAKEYLAALWCKLYLDYDVQQTLVGGQTPDGKDATNDISYMCFDVTEALGFIRCLSARLHKNISDKFLSRCVDLFTLGGGIPFFYNDEALIPALTRNGISLEDARGYAVIGCVEITLPGQALPHSVSNYFNHSKVLELAINNGIDMMTGEKIGIDVGNLKDFNSIEEIKEAFDKEFKYFEDMVCAGSNYIEYCDSLKQRLPFYSILTDGCIEKGKDILEGGAKYNWHESAAVAIPNLGDAFTALDHLLFKDKIIDQETLLKALKADFVGYEDLYEYIVHKIEKYGNDCDEPDMWVSRISEEYVQKMEKHRTYHGGRFFSQLFSFTVMLEYGKKTAASVDGRHAGTPLAYSLSPGQGRDIDSITATIKSLSKIKHNLCAASTSAILEIDPSLVEKEGKDALVALLRSAINMGVGQLQFNCVSKETLIDAKAHPEKHPSLAVRVSGFSQKFSLLEPNMQDHIIARTKHKN